MNPQIARTLAAQHNDELSRHAAEGRRVPGRRLPRLSVSWTRAQELRGSSVMIIVSAHRRPATPAHRAA